MCIRATLNALLCIAGLLIPVSSQSQGYPDRPVRLIAPFSAGGTTDIVARVVAKGLGETFGQQVIVDNRPGAGGIIGTELAKNAKPDGYTLLLGHIGIFAMNPALYMKLPYDPVKDFEPVSLLVSVPNGLVVHPSMPVHSVQELIKIARAKPGEILYASAGPGSATHLATVYFSNLAKLELTHVPYKGAGPALVEVSTGQTSMMIPGIPPLKPYVETGRLRLLAVTSAKRVPVFPNVPTFAESGLPAYAISNWQGITAPASTPNSIINKLNLGLRKVLDDQKIQDQLTSLGLVVVGSGAREFGDHIKAEIARWKPVVESAGIKAR